MVMHFAVHAPLIGEILVAKCKLTLLGNHDQAAMFDPVGFNEVAEAAIYWTRSQLDLPIPNRAARDRRWELLASFPRRHKEGTHLFVHGSARNPIDVTAQGVHSGGLQKIIDLLSVSDQVDAFLLVLSLSIASRLPFKPADLKPVVAAPNKPIVFYPSTLPSQSTVIAPSAAGVRENSGGGAQRGRRSRGGSALPGSRR